jgi:hypothetical protein
MRQINRMSANIGILNLVLALAGTTCLVSCGTVAVRSSPTGADITVMQPGKMDAKPLGKTPFEGKLSDLGTAANSGPIVIQIRKDGYIPQSLYVPNASGSRLEFDTNLKPLNPGSYEDMNKIIKLVLQAERQIMLKQVDEALKTATAIKAMNDNISVAWEIEGAAHFVKGDLSNAKIAWTRSLEIDPENPDTARMLQTIDEKSGAKK